MPDSQQPHYVANRVESIQREVSRVAVRDHEFAQFAFCATAYERVIGELLGRIDYLRHFTGLGRFTALPRTLVAT